MKTIELEDLLKTLMKDMKDMDSSKIKADILNIYKVQ